MDEEPGVSAARGVFALEGEGEGGGGEVDYEEGEEEEQDLVEAVGGGGLGVEVLVDEVVDDAGEEHDVDERGEQREEDLEDEDVGKGEEAHGAVAGDGSAVLEDGLQDSEAPA